MLSAAIQVVEVLGKNVTTVKEQLWKIIEHEIDQIQETSPLEQEILAQQAFADERAEVFVGRKEIRSQIQRYLMQPVTYPLVIHGLLGLVHNLRLSTYRAHYTDFSTNILRALLKARQKPTCDGQTL